MSAPSIVRMDKNPDGFGKTPDRLDADDFASGVPLQHTHSHFEDEDLGLYVGLWDTQTMVEAPGPYGCDEFMWLLEGEAEIENKKTGAIEEVHAPQAFILPRGYNCQWHQRAYLRKFYVIYEPPEETEPDAPTFEGVIIPGANITGQRDKVLTPFIDDKAYRSEEEIRYRNKTGSFVAGTCKSGPLRSVAAPFPFYEFFCVHEGSISIQEPDGSNHRFVAGDAFFIPKGLSCGVEIEDGVTMFFNIIRPA